MRTRIKGEQWFDVRGERYRRSCLAETSGFPRAVVQERQEEGWYMVQEYVVPNLYTHRQKDPG